jgi:hypothetical protein
VGYQGKIISTIDGGNTWTEQTSGTFSYLTSVYFTNKFNGWAVGKEGTILKTITGINPIDEEPNPVSNSPQEFVLYANFPNPFNPTTAIRYALPERTRVTLKIYNNLGQEIRTLVNEVQPAGTFTVEWRGNDKKGADVSSGIYFYKLAVDHQVEIRKMILLK